MTPNFQIAWEVCGGRLLGEMEGPEKVNPSHEGDGRYEKKYARSSAQSEGGK